MKTQILRTTIAPALAFAALIVFFVSPAQSFHFPWDQGHDTTDWDDPDDPGPCEGPNCDPCSGTGSPVYVQTGHFVRTDIDIEIPGRVPLSVRRTYNSNDPRLGAFGAGWTATCDLALVETRGSRDTDEDGLAELVTAYILRLPNGKRYTYSQIGDGPITPPAGRFDQVVPRADGDNELVERAGNRRVFGPDGQLKQEVDRFGNTKTYDYGSSGRLERIRGQAGRFLEFGYNSAGFVSSITDHSGRVWGYAYDSAGALVAVTDPLGGIKRYEYTQFVPFGDLYAYSLLTKIVDQAGVTVSEVTYSDGKVGTHRDRQNLYQYQYDENARRVTKTDSLGDTTVYTYNAEGQITRVRNGLGQEMLMGFEDNGRMTRNTDPAGNSWSATYDPQGRKIGQTDPLGNTTNFNYAAAGPNPTVITSRTGRMTMISYDANNQPVAVTDNSGNAFNLTWDDDGDLVAFMNASREAVTYEHNDAGHVATITDALGRIARYDYDSVGNMVRVINPAGETTTLTYDALTRVTRMTDPLGNASSFTYDSAGRVRSVTDAVGAVTTFSYDSFGRLSQRVAPIGRNMRYAYRADNILASVTRGDGTLVSYQFDAAKRQVLRDADGAVTSYAYDSRGLLVGASNAVGSVSRSYDAVGRLIGESIDGRDIVRTLNPEGERVALSVMGMTTQYTRDDRGRIVEINAPVGRFAFDNDSVGRRTELRRPDGSVSAYTYDAAGQLVEIAHTGAFDALYSYVYDEAGRITTWVGDGSDWQYEYDAAGRLLLATHGVDTFLYSYDSKGNLTQDGAAYDAENRLIQDDEFDYTYDANSNLIEKQHRTLGARTTYEWTELLQLERVSEFPDAASIVADSVTTYEYGPLGRRWSRTTDGVLERFIYDGLNRVATVNDRDSIIASVTFGPRFDDPLGAELPQGTRFYHQNHQGSVMALTDGSNVTDRYSYDPYGNTIAAGTSQNPFRFTGREAEDDSFYYYRARYYSAADGRFTSPDPIGFRSGDHNVFRYALSDPVNGRDPLGQNTMVLGGGIGGTIADGPGVVAGVIIGGLVLLGGYIVYNEITDDSSDETSDSQPDSPPIPDVPPIPDDPAQCPADGWDWRGNPDFPVGGDKGAWHNPETGESLHPDLDHAPPIGPHWDYKDPDGNGWRVFPDGSVTPK